MNWEKTHVEFGTVKVGSVNAIRFKLEVVPEDLEITKLESSCGCSTPTFDKESGFLTVKYKAQNLPRQRKALGFYTTTKRINVVSNKGIDKLTFKATVEE